MGGDSWRRKVTVTAILVWGPDMGDIKEKKTDKILLFLKKKKQKDFYQFGRVAQFRRWGLGHVRKLIKVFCFFFSKKKAFLPNRPGNYAASGYG
jgi:hypothetical protein